MSIKDVFDFYRTPKTPHMPVSNLPEALRSTGLYPNDKYLDTLSEEYKGKKITREEFEAICKKTESQQQVDLTKVITAFKIFDRDDSGTVTSKDLIQIFQSSEKLSKAEIASILSAIDPNDSGAISYSGLVKMIVGQK